VTFWTLDRVAAARAGAVTTSAPRGRGELTGITTDSRAILPGQLFVALAGANFDGHDYLQAAVASGAGAVLVSRPIPLQQLGVPVYEVDDTLVALGRLGSYWRKAWGKTVIAVAGSNGKTTTKDLIRSALSGEMAVHATSGNLNNRIGVPLTLLAIPASTEIAVVEVGTNLPGEVAILRDIATPDVAVVTSIGEEHLEGLGDLGGVLREEVAVFHGVRIGISPASQPEIAAAGRGMAATFIEAGLDEGDVRPSGWRIGADGAGVIELDDVVVAPPLRGLHNLRNTMLAIAVARVCGVTDASAAAGIAAMQVPRMRAALEQLGEATLINDAYNANPGSTRAALELLGGMGSARQRVVVLGTMRELGSASAQCHDDISRLALGGPADLVAGIGEFEHSLERIAPGDSRVVTAGSVDELWALLRSRIEPDAVILLKASRGVQLEQLVPHLTTWATH